MVYPAQSPETVHASMPSCWFIFAGMWLFVYNYVSADSWVGFAEKINKKYYFLMLRWSIEIGPDISLPPCIWGSRVAKGLLNLAAIFYILFHAVLLAVLQNMIGAAFCMQFLDSASKELHPYHYQIKIPAKKNSRWRTFNSDRCIEDL